MALYIVTGASKGIGYAIAEFLSQDSKNTLIPIARHNSTVFQGFIEGDLTEDNTLDKIKNSLLSNAQDHDAFYLINNAGRVDPMGTIGKIDTDAISQAFDLNVVALIKLSNLFVSTLKDVHATKAIMNISSGAGRKPYVGWGVYGATKAAVDHFTTILCEEQKEEKFPVLATSIAPGVIDTDMQSVIRGSEEESFPLVNMFKELKNTNKLSSPNDVAKKLLNYLNSNQMGTEPITDIRTLS